MTHRQKHKGKKRPRSWHHRYNTPDKAFTWAERRIEQALRRASSSAHSIGETKQ